MTVKCNNGININNTNCQGFMPKTLMCFWFSFLVPLTSGVTCDDEVNDDFTTPLH